MLDLAVSKLQGIYEVEDINAAIQDFKTEVLKAADENVGEAVQQLCVEYREAQRTCDCVGETLRKLKENKSRCDIIVDTLKDLIGELLQGEEFMSADFSVKYRKSTKLEIANWEKVPEEFFNERSENDINKKKLKAAVQEGATFEGVKIQEYRKPNIKFLTKEEAVEND